MNPAKASRAALAGALVAGAAAVAPLHGDPRVSSVSHPEWARMLLRGLDLDSPGARLASDVFNALSWHSSLAFPADEFERAEEVRRIDDLPHGIAPEQSSAGSAWYPLIVAREGDYSVRARLAGPPETTASATVARRGEGKPLATFSFRPAARLAWLPGGRVHLGAGSYQASVVLPPGTSMDRLEVTPPCVVSIEPLGGWHAGKLATTTDLAVSMLRALDLESDLDTAGAPIEIAGNRIQQYLPALSAASGGGVGFRGGETGAEGLLAFEVSEAGLYSVSLKGAMGGGQRWLADGCQKALICASARAALQEAGWIPVMTSEFAAGGHAVSVRLGAGATVEEVRIERKRNDPAAYLEAVRRLGLDPGSEVPLARSRAVEAVQWLLQQRSASPSATCPELAAPKAPQEQVAQLRQPGHRARRAGEPPARPGISPFVPAPPVARPMQ